VHEVSNLVRCGYRILRELSRAQCITWIWRFDVWDVKPCMRHCLRLLLSIIIFALQLIVYLTQSAEYEAWCLPASVGWPMAYSVRSPARYRCNWAISVLDFGSAVIGRAADAHRWSTYLRYRWGTFDSLKRSAGMVCSFLRHVHGTRGVLGSSWRRTIEDHRRVRSPEKKKGM